MKYCPRCDTTLPLDAFNKSGNRGAQAFCRCCQRAYERQYYKDFRAATRKENTQERRAWYKALKKNKVCVICGESDSRCLDFHHRIPADKKFPIANVIAGTMSKKKILAEIAKCDVLCSNCHRKHHY